MLPQQTAVYAFIAVFGIGLVFANLGVPAWFSWVGDLVPPRESNHFWNRRGGLSQLSLVLSSIAVGLVIDYFGKNRINTYVGVVGAGTVFGLISMAFLFFAREPVAKRQPRQFPLISKIRLIWRKKTFRQLVYFFGLQSFAQWLIIPFTFIYLQRSLNLRMSVIQLLVALCGIISFFSTYAFQIIGSKYGRKPIILACTFVKGIEFIFWALLLPESPWFIIIIPFLIGGVVNIGLLNSSFSLITSFDRRQLKSMAIALFFAITGLLGFAASSLSGFVYDYLQNLESLQNISFTPFNVISAFASALLFTSMLLFFKFNEEGAIPTAKVVKILFSNNPFRSIYHTYVLSNPLQEKSRIKALNKASGNLMVSELVNDLYSPSNRIRESAVWNIGRKGEKADPILAEELLKTLNMPALGIQAQAARALGHIRYAKATRELVKYIDNRDTTLAQSCIFALGMIGGKAVIAELENVLLHDRFRNLWPHAAEALGRIGDFHQTRNIYNAYKSEFNWVLKKQFLIALLRTLAKDRNKVFPLFEQEEKAESTVSEKLVNSIRSAISKKEKSLELKETFTQVLEYLDQNNYIDSLESLLVLLFNYQGKIFSRRKWTVKNLTRRLDTLFAANQKIKSRRLLKNDRRTVLFWLLIRLWAELKYSPSTFDGYTYITALQVVEFVVK
jgi:HEAT repeat protein